MSVRLGEPVSGSALADNSALAWTWALAFGTCPMVVNPTYLASPCSFLSRQRHRHHADDHFVCLGAERHRPQLLVGALRLVERRGRASDHRDDLRFLDRRRVEHPHPPRLEIDPQTGVPGQR